ncbi:MAG TPA: LamG-like jellyroll fold domain-containing protein, partial [Polyangia bacterium]|nr:LamG-like jellyroll fold domain-containing protein [Polyangia bacterium]
EMWLYFEGNESWKAEHSIVEYGGTGRCEAFGIDGGDNGMKNPVQFDPFTFSAGGPCKGDDNNTIMPMPPRTGWLHLAWVYDPAGTLTYSGMQNLNFLFTVNGVPQNIPDKKQMGSLLTMKTPVSIGSGQTTNNGFTGKIDEFRMWNVARSAQEIADNYKLILKGDEPGLVAYYHFDDGTGTTLKDSSSKHHDAMFATGHPAPSWVDSTDLTLTCK